MLIDEFETLNMYQNYSKEKIYKIREALQKIEAPFDYLCIYAVGSIGRLEANPETSDFEWLLVFDDHRVTIQEVNIIQAKVAEVFAGIFGRENLSINKTFGQTCCLSDLGANIGGLAETNRILVYRIIPLTEGTSLTNEKGHHMVIKELAKVYAGTHTAGHRMLSLATELIRFYRTLRVGYKYKVDEEGKPWAIRAIKMRSLRRFNYFSSILYFVTFGPRINYSENGKFEVDKVTDFLKTMGGSPVQRLLKVASNIKLNEDYLRKVLQTYDLILTEIGKPELHKHLDLLEPYKRFNDETFNRLRSYCTEMHAFMAQLVMNLPEPYLQELIEMFLL